MRVIALLNAKAGTLAASDGGDEARVREAFGAAGIGVEVRGVPGHELADAARKAAGEKPDAVVAGGGDGTQSAVASALANSGIAMGVLPLGTLNHFAKDLGIPQDLAGAVGVIAAGRVRKIDLGQVNGRTFVNNSSIGIYPHIVRGRDSRQERLGRGKWLAMLLAVIDALRRYPTVRVRIGIDGRSVPRTAPFVFIGNNEYEIDLFSVKGRKYLDQGKLSLYVANRPGRFGMLRLALRALLGTLAQDKDFESTSAGELWIETGRKHLHVALDGEVVDMRPPLHYKSLAGALVVLVPAGREG
jgi:diacylglycerol kinase family enzyme